MPAHPVVTGRWLARTGNGATWDGYRVGQMAADDVVTYSGHAVDYAAVRDLVDQLETAGRIVWWHGSHDAAYGGTETHWTAPAHVAGVDWSAMITRGNGDTYAAPGYSWRLAVTPETTCRAYSGHADTLHGAMSDVVGTLLELTAYAWEV